MKNGRRMNYFKVIKGISLSSVANNGVHQDSRIAEAVDSVWLEALEMALALAMPMAIAMPMAMAMANLCLIKRQL